MFAVLRSLGTPLGLYNFFVALYCECNLYIHYKGHVDFMCDVKSGVLQGCPLAALLFVIAIEPFCILFKAQIDDLDIGRVRLCADDIGVVLQNWTHLPILLHILQLAEDCAGLQLNSSKCFIVPISKSLSPHLVSSLRDYLRTKKQHTAQCIKYIQRVDAAAQACVASSLS
eukprot:6661843-Karenia_brevis.AAC.1